MRIRNCSKQPLRPKSKILAMAMVCLPLASIYPIRFATPCTGEALGAVSASAKTEFFDSLTFPWGKVTPAACAAAKP